MVMSETRRWLIGTMSAIALLTCCIPDSTAQSSGQFSVLGGYDLDMHSAGFAKITSLGYCCPTDYGSLQGKTIYGGISYDIVAGGGLGPISILGIGVGYQQRGVDALFQASTYINDPETNQGRDATINYTMKMQRSDVFVDISPRLSLSSALKLTIGGRLAYGVSSMLTQREELPADLVAEGYYFIDPATQSQLPYRNVYEGALPSLQAFTIAAQAGLTFDIPLNQLGTVILTPGLWYRYQPSGFVSATTSRTEDPVSRTIVEQPGTWAIQSVGASLSLSFSSAPTVQLGPCQEIVNGRVVEKQCSNGQILRLNPLTNECSCEDTLRVDTSIVTLNAILPVVDGQRASTPLQQVEVIRSPRTVHLPIIYAIAFGAGSSNVDLVNRYIDLGPERKATFKREKSFGRMYQRHVLNVIGSKFAEGDITSLTIVGFASATDKAGEALSLERAMKVREHLYRRWGIPLAAFTVRAATPEERASYAKQLGSADDLNFALVYPNGGSSVVDYVTVVDKYIRVNPSQIFIEASVDLGTTKSVASLDYQMRLGGNTGGKMVQPVRSIINAGEPGMDAALKGWALPLSGPGADIEASLHALPAGESTKLIPTLRVTATTGQVVEAQRQNQRSVVPIRVVDNDNEGRSRDDSTYASVGLIEFQPGSLLERQQNQALTTLMKRLISTPSAVTIDRYSPALQQEARNTSLQLHESSEVIKGAGVMRVDQRNVSSLPIEREDPLEMPIQTLLFVRSAKR